MDDLIRVGRVSTVNYKAGTAKVVYRDRDDMVTGELPMLSSEYLMPKPDDMVLVLHLKNAPSRGVIVGPIYNDDNRPGISGKNKYHKKLTDNVELKANNRDFTLAAPGGINIVLGSGHAQMNCGGLDIKASGTVTIDADSIVFKGSSGTATLAQIISHITSH